MEIKIKDRNETWILAAICGRVDSTNASELERELFEIKEENKGMRIVLDAEELEYISSAGLRVLLKLRKEQGELKLVQVSLEVYEILQVTGFTELLTVEKKMRSVSLDGCEMIGRGGHGEVYRLNEDTILKLYPGNDTLEEIQREQEYSKKAFVFGIPTAIPFDVVKCGDKYGLIYEMVDADTLASCVTREPDRLDEFAKKWADLLKLLHTTKVEDGKLAKIRDLYQTWIDESHRYYTDEEVQKLQHVLDAIPDRPGIIHGDAHTKNIMVQNDELVMIDMADISTGYPLYDLSSNYLTHVLGKSYAEYIVGLPGDLSVEMFNRMVCYYFDLAPEESIEPYIQKIAAFTMFKYALTPLVDKSMKPELLQKILTTTRERFFPVADHLNEDFFKELDM